MMRRGFTLIELMIVIAVIAVLAAIAVPSILGSVRAGNERNASASLRSLIPAEITFKSSDADQNGINDYWTYDTAGLYYIAPTGGDQLRLIELPMALADAATRPTWPIWYYFPPYIANHRSSPKSGYWFCSKRYYENPSGVQNWYGYRHYDKFAFTAYPQSYGASGKNLFIISEQGTVYKNDPQSQWNYLIIAPVTGTTITWGYLKWWWPSYDTFPFDPTSTSPVVAGPWSKMD